MPSRKLSHITMASSNRIRALAAQTKPRKIPGNGSRASGDGAATGAV
jgi:hypothetical protein